MVSPVLSAKVVPEFRSATPDKNTLPFFRFEDSEYFPDEREFGEGG